MFNIHTDLTSIVNAEEAIESPQFQNNHVNLSENVLLNTMMKSNKVEIYNRIAQEGFDDSIIFKHRRHKKPIDMTTSINSLSSTSSDEHDGNISKPTIMNLSTVSIFPDHFNCQLSGRFEANIKRHAINTSCGDLTIGFSDNEYFHVRHNNEFQSIVVMVKPELLISLTGRNPIVIEPDKKTPFFIHRGKPNQQISLLANQLANLAAPQNRQPLLINSVALEFLHWQLNTFNPEAKKDILSARERKQLEQARDFLLSDLSTPPTIETMSKRVGLNQCKLKQGFKLLFSKSIYAYFLSERMKKARYLLYNNSVTETAIIMGYSNVSHFSSAFRKQFGLLPKDARRQLIGLNG